MKTHTTTNGLAGLLPEDYLDELDLKFDPFASGKEVLPLMTFNCIKFIASTHPDALTAGTFGESDINDFLTKHFKI